MADDFFNQVKTETKPDQSAVIDQQSQASVRPSDLTATVAEQSVIPGVHVQPGSTQSIVGDEQNATRTENNSVAVFPEVPDVSTEVVTDASAAEMAAPEPVADDQGHLVLHHESVDKEVASGASEGAIATEGISAATGKSALTAKSIKVPDTYDAIKKDAFEVDRVADFEEELRGAA
jgi:hypothetical protein